MLVNETYWVCYEALPTIWIPDIHIDQAPPDSGLGQLQSAPSATSDVATDIGFSDRYLGDGMEDQCGNPVNVLSRNKTQRELDYVGPGSLPLRIERTYNSKFASSPDFRGYFGAGWSSNFEERVVSVKHPNPSDNPQITEAVLQNDSGFRFRIKSINGGGWTTATGRPVMFDYDATQKIYTWIDRGLIKVFLESGHLHAIEHENGEQLVFEYVQSSDPARLSKVRHTSGAELTFAYDSSARITTITDSAGRNYTYAYGSYNNLDIVTRPDVGTAYTAVNYDYADWSSSLNKNQLVKIKHPELGLNFASFGYANIANEASYTKHGSAGVERFDFLKSATTPQLVIDVTNPHGKVAKYKYSNIAGAKRLTRIDGQAHGTCLASNSTYTYDSNGYFDKITDEEGNIVDYNFNAMGQPESVTTGFGTPNARTITRTWFSDWEKPESVSTPLLDVDYEIDGRGRTTKITETNKAVYGIPNQQRVWAISYTNYPGTSVLQTITIDGRQPGSGDLTTISQDANGLITQISRRVTSTLSLNTTYSNYDAHGRVGRITMPTGMTRDFVYHPRGWITGITDTVNGVARQTQYAYFSTGQLKTVTKADGSTLTFNYDDAHRLVEIVDYEDNKSKYTYDTASNATKHEITKLQLTWVPGDPTCNPFLPPFPECQGGSWQMEDRVKYWRDFNYDSLSRLTKTHRNTMESQDYTYLKNSQLDLIKDGFGRSTDLDYNANNELVDTTYRDTGQSQVTYDANGYVNGVRDALGQWTYYHRDGFGQVAELNSPATSNPTYFEYDAAGNLTKKTDARGTVLHYAYDSDNRLINVRVGSPAAAPIQTFQYDTNRAGYLYRVTDEAGTHTFTRNQAGQILSKASNLAGTTLTVSYTYDVMGRVDSITYPSGVVANYDYDTVGNVERISASAGGLAATDVVNTVVHYPWGPVSSLKYGNGESRSIILDGGYTPYKLLSGAHINRTYSTDANDNITAFDGRTITYDVMDRLKTHTGPDGSWQYGYDLNGNRNWHKRNAVQTTYNYNTARTRLNSLTGGTSETRAYDASGNTVRIGSRALDYNNLNRFWRYTEGSTTVTYTHNAFGERQLKSSGTTTTRFVYDGPRLLHERVGTTKRDYIYLAGEVVGMVKNGVLYFVHNDHLGRPEVVTNAAKAVVWSSENNAFGNNPGASSIGDFNLGFPGQYYDIESATYYNYFRTYDAMTGRYLQSDPIGLAGGLNQYSYGNGNPIGQIDPYGLTSIAIEGRVAVWGARVIGGAFCAIPVPGARVIGVGIIVATIPGDTPIDPAAMHNESAEGGANGQVVSPPASDVSGNPGSPNPNDLDPDDERQLVIGKVTDLKRPGEVSSAERTLLSRLPNRGNPQANWEQNASILRQEMSGGKPIRDASVDPRTGALRDNTGFLRAERELLRNHGWRYDPVSRSWLPPGH